MLLHWLRLGLSEIERNKIHHRDKVSTLRYLVDESHLEDYVMANRLQNRSSCMLLHIFFVGNLNRIEIVFIFMIVSYRIDRYALFHYTIANWMSYIVDLNEHKTCLHIYWNFGIFASIRKIWLKLPSDQKWFDFIHWHSWKYWFVKWRIFQITSRL